MSKNTNKLKTIHFKNQTKQSPAKRKCRNESEKRRRDLFSQLITNLEDVLSIQTNSSSNKLDKASILRQALLFLKIYQQNLIKEDNLLFSSSVSTSSKCNDIIDFCWKPSSNIISNDEWFEIVVDSINCFFLVINNDNKIVYVSKNVQYYLGYEQNDIINHSLFEYILPLNNSILKDYLLNNHKVLKSCDLCWKRCFDDNYEECTIIGAFRTMNEKDKYLMSIVKLNKLDGRLIVNCNNKSCEELISYLNVDGKFLLIDSNREYLGYNSFELIGRTHFDFVHPDDLSIVVRAHQLWKQNGNGLSDPYRFLTKGQQWIYLQTSCQVQLNSWNGKVDYYICTTNTIQFSNKYFQKSISIDNQSNYSKMEYSSVDRSSMSTTIISESSNSEEKSGSSKNEITLFLSNLPNENYRKNIREKLIERQKIKENEIRIRQEEIQIIEDIIQFIDQYQLKHSINQQTNNYISDEFLNVFDTNWNSTLLNTPLINSIDDYSIETNVKDDSFPSLFSPSSSTTAFNIQSPIITLQNNPSNQNTFIQNQFS